ncbi:MAG: glycosyltransferase family 39 protein, partial [Acidobacteria bacterium]|nr:glycosyltransferase family 39 protein [Acidobacteriota bacterium]
WLARISDEVFGGALWSLRIWPVLAGAATVLVTGLLARRLGGGRFAQGLAMLAVVVGPFFLRVGNLLHLPSFEPLFWTSAVYLAVTALSEERPGLWLGVGVVAGLGLLNKHTMLLFGGALVVALLLTPARRAFRSPWLWAGGAVAFLLLLPNLLWQVANGWPTATFIANMQGTNSREVSPLLFALGQLFYQGPLSAPLWIGGLVFCFRTANERLRLVGWIYVLLFGALMLIGSKIYYIAP